MSQTMEATAAQFSELLDRNRLTDRLTAMVQEPSENPPGEEGRVGAQVAAYCEELGLEVDIHELDEGRPNVVARWGSGSRVVGYCSHFDVIPAGDHSLWEREPYGGEVVDGRMHGRGTADAKGPIAAALEAVAILRGAGFEPDGTLELALVSDEETMGFIGAGYLVEQGLIRPEVAIVGEPTSLRVVHAQRGACWFKITTRGTAGHGSAPERGRSAIKHMAEIVLHLEDALPRVNHEVLGGPSVNAGTIRGGTKVNVVPASCVVEVDRRSVPPETRESVIASVEEAVENAKKRFPDIDATVELEFYGEPFVVEAERASCRTSPPRPELPPAVLRSSSGSAELRMRGFWRRRGRTSWCAAPATSHSLTPLANRSISKNWSMPRSLTRSRSRACSARPPDATLQ